MPNIDNASNLSSPSASIEPISERELIIQTKYDDTNARLIKLCRAFLAEINKAFDVPTFKKQYPLNPTGMQLLTQLNTLLENSTTEALHFIEFIETGYKKLDPQTREKIPSGNMKLLEAFKELKLKLPLGDILNLWSQDNKNFKAVSQEHYKANRKTTQVIESVKTEGFVEVQKVKDELNAFQLEKQQEIEELKIEHLNTTNQLLSELNTTKSEILNLSRLNASSTTKEEISFVSANKASEKDKDKKLKPYLSPLAFKLVEFLAEVYLPELQKELQNASANVSRFTITGKVYLDELCKNKGAAEQFIFDLLETNLTTKTFLHQNKMAWSFDQRITQKVNMLLEDTSLIDTVDALKKLTDKWKSFYQVYNPKTSTRYLSPCEVFAQKFKAHYEQATLNNQFTPLLSNNL